MPLARHDRSVIQCMWNIGVSTHMPLARHDLLFSIQNISYHTFLLTCLLRGMTEDAKKLYGKISFLLTCLLRGMTVYMQLFFVIQ